MANILDIDDHVLQVFSPTIKYIQTQTLQIQELEALVREKDVLLQKLKSQVREKDACIADIARELQTTQAQLRGCCSPPTEPLAAYDSPDTAHISDELLRIGLNGPKHCIVFLIDAIYFHPSNLANRSVSITNLQSDVARVYNGAEWLLQDKSKVINTLVNISGELYTKWLATWPNQEDTAPYRIVLDCKADARNYAQLYNDIQLLLYNRHKSQKPRKDISAKASDLAAREEVRAATSKYKRACDPCARLFEEHLVADPDARLSTGAMRGILVKFNGQSAAKLSMCKLNKWLRAKGYEPKASNGTRYYPGLRCISSPSQDCEYEESCDPHLAFSRDHLVEEKGAKVTYPQLKTLVEEYNDDAALEGRGKLTMCKLCAWLRARGFEQKTSKVGGKSVKDFRGIRLARVAAPERTRGLNDVSI